ncbi:hypothetical protein E2C01_046100 [Portunus trituberculatus]|uniref:Uncharacterized protein n=1 Tax=Portunus trituberculatus TaxID=210409 RepID=A0A5B7G3R3_PORTR|nr:hypothetical protein [Portunus trituberculatus]
MTVSILHKINFFPIPAYRTKNQEFVEKPTNIPFPTTTRGLKDSAATTTTTTTRTQTDRGTTTD